MAPEDVLACYSLLVLFLGVDRFEIATAQVCPTTSYEKKQNGKLRRTTLLDGDYILLSLMTNSDGGSCENVTSSGLVRVLGFQYALESINNRTDLLPWVRLGYQMDDACYSVPVAMARSIEAVSLYRSNGLCSADQRSCMDVRYDSHTKPVSAVVGTWYSFTSIPVASLLSLYKIPQISDSASSLLLSNKANFASFFRTIPSDVNQVEAILDLINYFEWKYIFVVGADDDYGRLAISELKRQGPARNICISHDEYIPYQLSIVKQKAKEIVTLIKEAEQAKVVVLFTYAVGNGEYILQEAELQGVRRLWITSDSWSPDALSLNVSREQLKSIISLSMSSAVHKDFQEFVRNSILRNFYCNAWLRNYIEMSFSCRRLSLLNYSLVGERCSADSTCRRCVVPVDDVLLTLSPASFWQVNDLIDAVHAVAYAMNASLQQKCGNSSICRNATTLLSPPDIFEAMKTVSFTNPAGNVISFDKNGDPTHVNYAICTVSFESESPKMLEFATWKKQRSPDRLIVNHTSFKWPTWVKPYPLRSTCGIDCQPGQYVVGRTGCCWACRNCEGTDSISFKVNADACSKCPPSYHTRDNIRCVPTPTNHLLSSRPVGIAILVISSVGILLSVLAFILLLWLWRRAVVQHSAPVLQLISIFLLLAAFVYGTLHLAMPSKVTCRVRDCIFYCVLALFPSVIFVRTLRVTSALAKVSFSKSTQAAQASVVACIFILQFSVLLAWCLSRVVDTDLIKLSGFEMWLQCEAQLGTFRLVVTFIPVTILVATTLIAFQERKKEHCYKEPKYIFFAATAMCIITASYIPTLNFVVGQYKSAVLAVTQAAYGYTYLGCLLLPKLYTGLVDPNGEGGDSDVKERHDSQAPCVVYEGGEFKEEYSRVTKESRQPGVISEGGYVNDHVKSRSYALENQSTKGVDNNGLAQD